MFNLALFVLFIWFKHVVGDDSITASLLEEVMSLKDQISTDCVQKIADVQIEFLEKISALELEIQELQLTSTSCTCDSEETIG